MKIKEICDDRSLGGLKFKHPETGEAVFWHSQWEKGIWYRKDDASSRVYPLFVEKLEDALEFEVIE